MDYPVEVEVPPPIIGRKREVKLWAHLCTLQGKGRRPHEACGAPVTVKLRSLYSNPFQAVLRNKKVCKKTNQTTHRNLAGALSRLLCSCLGLF